MSSLSELSQALCKCFFLNTVKCVLSTPTVSTLDRKVVFKNIGGRFQCEVIKNNQAFHYNYSYQDCFQQILNLLSDGYRQLNCIENSSESCLRISKRGKIFVTKGAAKDVEKTQIPHNRNKRRLLPKDTVVPILVDIGLMTIDGKPKTAMQDKHKQVNRYLEIIYDAVKDWVPARSINIIDFGCGNSYLTFVLYHYLTEILGFSVKLTGVDIKHAAVDKCNALALKYGYKDLRFVCTDLAQYVSVDNIDIVISLHACDIATDHVIEFAVNNGVSLLFAVPCCQHELNNQLKASNCSIMTRYGLIKERFAALATDAIRANVLEYFGYRTQVLEFVDFEHTAKNIMIRSKKSNIPSQLRESRLKEALHIVDEYGLKPTILQLLLPQTFLKNPSGK